MFGGYTGSYSNDAYVLDMETWVWRCTCLYILICLFCTYCFAAGDPEWKHFYIIIVGGSYRLCEWWGH